MADRPLTQVSLSFLLGIWGAWLGGLGQTIVWCLWVFLLMWYGWRRFRGVPPARPPGRRFLACLLPGILGIATLILGQNCYRQRQNQLQGIEEHIAEYQEVSAQGTIYKKEVKYQNTIYYLKESHFLQGSEDLSADRILAVMESDHYVIGDTILVKGTGSFFRCANNQGNFNERQYYNGKGIGARIQVEESGLIADAEFPWRENLYQLRGRIQQVYANLLPSEEAGVLCVMALGDKTLLDSEIKSLYQQSGISHVLAISGLHISLVGMGLYRLLRRFLGYASAGLAAGCLVLIFGEIAGMELSTQRAVLMFLVMIAGNAMGMAYDSVTALSLSALLQLWENPLSLWYAGFQFSYAAVLAVAVAVKILAGKGKISGNVLFVSGCIQLVTLPLTLYHYYEFPLYTVLINGLLLPLMGILLTSGLLGGLSGLLSAHLGKLLLLPAYGLLEWIAWVCGQFARLPGAMWITGCPKLSVLVGYYILLAACLLWMERKRHRAVVIIPVLALIVLLLTSGTEGAQITFLDVGQGDGIFIRSQKDTVFMVDGGSTSEQKVGEYRILSFLKYHGISEIDGWFVSHGDQDHVSGLLELWELGYPIHQLFLARDVVQDEAWQQLCLLAETHGSEIVYLAPGDSVGDGNVKMTCLYPWSTGSDRNENSMVLWMEQPQGSVLLAGDLSMGAEWQLAVEYPMLTADVYKASHHGSNGSGDSRLLEQLKPKLSVVSCGAGNSYGHPGQEAIGRMEAAGSQILYTMEQGQITLGWDKEGRLWVRAYRNR